MSHHGIYEVRLKGQSSLTRYPINLLGTAEVIWSEAVLIETGIATAETPSWRLA